MARARNIKPSFFHNEELGMLTPLARLLFIGLWTIADFRGNLELRPKRLRIQLLPYDDCNVEELTINLEHSGLIKTYSVQGQRYINIVNFERHQNPHKNERDGGSDIPDISLKDSDTNDFHNIQNYLEQDGCNPADSPFPLPDSPIPQRKPDKPARIDPAAIALPACISRNDWIEWIAYRRERRLSVKTRTLEAQIDNLVIWFDKGHYPPDVIKASIANGWQGLFEPKVQQQSYHDERKETYEALTGKGKRNDEPTERDITGEATRIA